jgi:hypothetical protein
MNSLIDKLFSKNKKITKNRDVFSKKISKQWKVIKRNSEYVLMFNDEGNFIWGLIERKYLINDIFLKYSKKYKVDIDKSRKMVNLFISECKESKLIK